MRFVLELYLPRGAAERARDQAGRLRAAAAELCEQGRRIEYLTTLVLPEDESCLHVLEAPDEATVTATARQASLDRPRIRGAFELLQGGGESIALQPEGGER